MVGVGKKEVTVIYFCFDFVDAQRISWYSAAALIRLIQCEMKLMDWFLHSALWFHSLCTDRMVVCVNKQQLCV